MRGKRLCRTIHYSTEQLMAYVCAQHFNMLFGQRDVALMESYRDQVLKMRDEDRKTLGLASDRPSTG